MSKPFGMQIFLAGVLTGSHATRERHLRQAKAIHISTGSALDSQNMTVHISELELRDDTPTLVFFGNAA